MTESGKVVVTVLHINTYVYVRVCVDINKDTDRHDFRYSNMTVDVKVPQVRSEDEEISKGLLLFVTRGIGVM